MNEIRVECYAGYRADERPLRFTLRGRQFTVHELDGRWYSPQASYFRVIADDGNFYVLRHDEAQDFWTLDGFRAAGRRTFEDAAMPMIKADMRRCERILVPGAVILRAFNAPGSAAVEGIITAIGLGGMFLRAKDRHHPGTVLNLIVQCSMISIALEGTVRHVNEHGMGIEFTQIPTQNEIKLKKIIELFQT